MVPQVEAASPNSRILGIPSRASAKEDKPLKNAYRVFEGNTLKGDVKELPPLKSFDAALEYLTKREMATCNPFMNRYIRKPDGSWFSVFMCEAEPCKAPAFKMKN